MIKRNCDDCGVLAGESHAYGCDVERCPKCGGQVISCHCIYDINSINYEMLETEHPEIYSDGPTDAMYVKWDAEWGPRRMKWTGEWPGTAECREYGFWSLWVPNPEPFLPGGAGKWVEVPVGTPGATEDLNKLYMVGIWNPETQKMELPRGSE